MTDLELKETITDIITDNQDVNPKYVADAIYDVVQQYLLSQNDEDSLSIL